MTRDARWNINTYNHKPRQLYAVPKTDQPSVRSQNTRVSNEPRTVHASWHGRLAGAGQARRRSQIPADAEAHTKLREETRPISAKQ